MVLNDTQRLAKRQLIEDNRDRRKVEAIRAQLKAEQTVDHMTTEETELVRSITAVYYATVEVTVWLFEPEVLRSAGSVSDH